MSNLIMTPQDDGFMEILHSSLPPGWNNDPGLSDNRVWFIPNHETGLLTLGTEDDMIEFYESGAVDEYDCNFG